ncbi:uncharacterized protein TNCV_1682091 [Trichonephila clavipes]|nr:uncharacterized protein TNCV_1682091 [Trichonephila clavipes]
MNPYMNSELVDIHFIYDLANGNGRSAVRLYGERNPMKRQPNHQTFTPVHQNLKKHGSFRTSIDDTPINSKMDLVMRISNAVAAIREKTAATSVRVLTSQRPSVWRIFCVQNLSRFNLAWCRSGVSNPWPASILTPSKLSRLYLRSLPLAHQHGTTSNAGTALGRRSTMLSVRLNLDDDAVPITPQTSSIPLNYNKTIIAKRKHFPLISALAVTIHKSQGGIYEAIVYEYDRKHPRELVYVALTRVTRIQGLFLVTQENISSSRKFWIGRTGTPLNASETDKHHKRSTSHREDLTLELKRLQNNTLQTVTKTFLEFISNTKGLSIFSFNCQSTAAPYNSNECLRRKTKLKRKVILKLERDREPLSTLDPTLFNSLGEPLILIRQSPLIGERNRSAHGCPHFSPNPLVLGDNRPPRLIATPTLYLVHHLEAYKLPCHTDTEGVSFVTNRPKFIFIQID